MLQTWSFPFVLVMVRIMTIAGKGHRSPSLLFVLERCRLSMTLSNGNIHQPQTGPYRRRYLPMSKALTWFGRKRWFGRRSFSVLREFFIVLVYWSMCFVDIGLEV